MNIYEETELFYKRANTEKRVIGKSLLGRNIYAVRMGEGSPVGIAQYSIHGREWIATKLAFLHYTIPVKGSVWLIPLMNPDGALLSQEGISSVKGEKHRKFLLSIANEEDFPLWKANARGVDLNVNFPAFWGKGRKNQFVAGRENYVGKYPLSEPESICLQRFTEEISPDYTVSYHTKGEEIYWYFFQPLYECVRDKKIALELAKSSGYALKSGRGSVGGYKDWCIKKWKIPSFTIELGKDEETHPLSMDAFPDIARKNQQGLYVLSRAYEQEERRL